MPDDKKVVIKDTRSHIPVTKRLHSEIDRDKLMSIISESIKEGVNPYTALGIAMKEGRMGESRSDYGVNEYAPLNEKFLALSNKREALQKKYGYYLPPKRWIEGTMKERVYQELIEVEKRTNPQMLKKDLEDVWAQEDDAYKMNAEFNSWSPEKAFVKALKNKFDYAKKLGYKDEVMQIQAFNGLGILDPRKIPASSTSMGVSMYGSREPIDMRKNPLYGKEIIDIQKNVMEKNETVNSMIGEAIKESMLMKLQEPMAEPPNFNF